MGQWYLWPHSVWALHAGGQLAGFFINNDEALATLPGEGQPADPAVTRMPQWPPCTPQARHAQLERSAMSF